MINTSNVALSQDEDELLQLQTLHPYSNFVQFSLLNLYKNDPEKYQEQMQKGSLLFSNTDILKLQQELYGKEAQIIISQPSVSSPQTDDALIFEPLHTVDYFASQGIKLTDEPVSNDKLGKQLKSFTQWLKTMKRINPDQQTPAQADDQNIQQIAENSNNADEVVTEAMAEVYIKQNRPEKARETYEKLSLLNPSKRAYFAAKIESLKQI